MNVLSLCSGLGGIELGLSLATGGAAHAVGYVEIDLYNASRLAQRMGEGHLRPAPIYSDLRSFDARPWGGVVDCLSAGAPCQPFSTASRGRKTAVDLLPEVARVAGECRAPLVFVENVPGSARGLVRFGEALLGLGYRVPEPIEVSAAALGAPHNRPRLWLLAYTDGEGQSLLSEYAEMARLRSVPEYAPWRDEPPSRALGMVHGASDRLVRLRALGNGVLPIVAARAWNVLAMRSVK